MLIECTECGHKVSDKADKCPECGCPVREILKCLREKEIYITDDTEIKDGMLICSINGKKADLTWIKEIVDKMDETELYHCKYVWNSKLGNDHERCLCLDKYTGTPEKVYYDKANHVFFEIRNKYELSYDAAAKFLNELVSSDFEMKEFDGMSEKEYQSMQAPIIQCPYCGSIDVKKVFFGGFAQKQWHCKKCRSDF